MARSCKVSSRWCVWAVFLLPPLAGLVGCGPGGLDLVPAAGHVTLDGQPLADAAVVFVSAEGGHLAHGVTDAEGQFTLTTTNRPGAVPGEHRVGITKQKVYDPTLDGGIGALRVEWIVPERYAAPDTSGLTVTVPPRGAQDLQFELTSQ